MKKMKDGTELQKERKQGRKERLTKEKKERDEGKKG